MAYDASCNHSGSLVLTLTYLRSLWSSCWSFLLVLVVLVVPEWSLSGHSVVLEWWSLEVLTQGVDSHFTQAV